MRHEVAGPPHITGTRPEPLAHPGRTHRAAGEASGSRVIERTAVGFMLTRRGRAGVGKLAELVRFERAHLPGFGTPISVADGLAALRATLTLVELPDHPDALIEFTVSGQTHGSHPVGHVWADMRAGRVNHAGPGRSPRRPAVVIGGSVDAWLHGVIEDDRSVLDFRGRGQLGRAVVQELHLRLHAAVGPVRSAPAVE